MSKFLQNLIDRHQEVNVGREISHKVQPRLKTKFETDTRSELFTQNDFNNGSEFTSVTRTTLDNGSHATQDVQDIGSIVPAVTAEGRQSTRRSQIPTQRSSEKPATESDFSRPIDVSEPFDTTIRQPGQKSSIAREMPIRAAESRNHRPPEYATENSEPPSHFNNPHSTLPDEVGQRIQAILHRLNNQQPQHEKDQRENKSQQKHANTNSSARTAPFSSITEQNVDLIQPSVKLKKQATENRPTQRDSIQAGLMQIPGWLTEMQADLNSRLQQMSTKAQPEPIINITIGRIEVKAVQAESGKTKIRNKPSGIMGLDEYLKQRANRGRG